MEKHLTCIVCPMGCEICVNMEQNRVLSITGNTCKRGEEYAKTECTNPMRIITTTVRTAEGWIIPVKTDRSVPKSMLSDCMREINKISPDTDGLGVGSCVFENLLNTGANVIVTAPLNKE